ncbi:MAG: tRNA (adenosine(37)-N6)-threonylcarbamoyltransferase complex transferase subunit TsaD [Hyphomicrobiales bacterium]|nr:tRNA (adenosine(37)-N6)-threonylcarbamoyltransferase complex transferase subunit TsaD [Hyphomicrobiales bacterium]
MRILGIETTCDETAAAVVLRRADGSGEILSNVIHSQDEAHARFGGVVPEIAARAHVELIDTVIAAALDEAGLSFADLDGVAAAAGPGLIGGVIVGLTTAKAIALVHDKPLIAVNHLEAHALTARLTDRASFPYLLLLVSGGHTQLIWVHGVGSYERLGTTVDDALGEAFDKTAKLLGLSFPGGPAVERMARTGDPKAISLPRPMLGRKELHFSFSGLKTAVRQAAEARAPLSDKDIADICAAFQAAVAESVVDRVRMALAACRARGLRSGRLVVAGGVAANAALRAALELTCEEEGVMLTVPPPSLCTDNGAMIAWAGAERLALGLSDPLDVAPRARWPLDPDAAPAPGAGVKA